MANIIKIKRSTTVGTPASLAQGELAYSESDGASTGSGNLFIGTATGLVKIGGNTDVTTLAGLTIFSSITGDTGTATADTQTDTIAITGGTGISTVASDGPEGLVITNDSPNVDQNLWFTFTGDTGTIDANTTSDSFAILGGTNITTLVSGDQVTITNDAPNITQNVWLTVAGDSGSTAADISTDTLTVAGGTGITTSMVGDTLTIVNDAPGGLQDMYDIFAGDTGTTSPTTSTDTVTFVGGTSITTTVTADTVTFDGTPLINSDTMAGASTTNVASATSIVNYVATEIGDALSSAVTYKGAYNAATNTPDLDVAPTGVLTGDMYTCTVAGTFFTVPLEVGDVLIAEIDDAAVEADWTIVNKDLPELFIYKTFTSDSGSAVVATIDDTLSILGGTGISTSVTGDTLTVTNDSPHVGTNLSVGTVTATNVPINSSTGTNISTLPAATATLAGIVTNAVQSFGGAKSFFSLTGTEAAFASTIDNFTIDCGTFT